MDKNIEMLTIGEVSRIINVRGLNQYLLECINAPRRKKLYKFPL